MGDATQKWIEVCQHTFIGKTPTVKEWGNQYISSSTPPECVCTFQDGKYRRRLRINFSHSLAC